MLRNVYLEGEIGEKFGREWQFDAASFKEVLNGIDCNVDGFRKYLIDCAERGIGFTCHIEGRAIEQEEELLMKLNEGDMIITAIPAGSKSAGAKILGAIALAAITYYTFGAGSWLATGWGTGGMSAATQATIAAVGYGMAVNLALAGVQQLMAPDPATDSGAETDYLFNGSAQNIIEGDPVPILYGELKVPGHPISFEVLNEEFMAINTVPVIDNLSGINL